MKRQNKVCKQTTSKSPEIQPQSGVQPAGQGKDLPAKRQAFSQMFHSVQDITERIHDLGIVLDAAVALINSPCEDRDETADKLSAIARMRRDSERAVKAGFEDFQDRLLVFAQHINPQTSANIQLMKNEGLCAYIAELSGKYLSADPDRRRLILAAIHDTTNELECRGWEQPPKF